MDMSEFLRNIDTQIEDLKKKATQESRPRDRRQQQIPVAIERRSGKDRRWCNQGLTKT